MVVEKVPVKRRKSKEMAIPDSLIYETIDGKPFYRKGYREVLSKNKTLEEIIASSSLQAVIISYLLEFLFTKIGSQYTVS